MDRTIYADVLFMINFSMDFLSLYIASVILKLPFSKARSVLSACAGALYGVIAVINRKDSIVVLFSVAVIMCIVSFGINGIKETALEFIAFVSVGFLLGGGMTAVFNIFNSFGYRKTVSVYGQIDTIDKHFTFPVFIFAFAVITAVCLFAARVISRKSGSRTVKAEITVKGKKETLLLSEDSGNRLTEPLSGEPVIFVSGKALEKIYGKETAQGIMNLEPEKANGYSDKIRLAVYETVGGKGIASCVKPDKAVIGGIPVKAYISASGKTDFGIYDGIIPSSLIPSIKATEKRKSGNGI